MKKYNKIMAERKDIFLGVDLHRKSRHVTVIMEDVDPFRSLGKSLAYGTVLVFFESAGIGPVR